MWFHLPASALQHLQCKDASYACPHIRELRVPLPASGPAPVQASSAGFCQSWTYGDALPQSLRQEWGGHQSRCADIRVLRRANPECHVPAEEQPCGQPCFTSLDSSRTKRTTCCTFSTGVPGTMPCPRLKMCPGLPAASCRICRTRLRINSGSAKSVMGSRFPCTAQE